MLNNIIVHCPTKEDFVAAQNKAFELGAGWWAWGKNLRYFWDVYKSDTCIRIENNNKVSYSDKPYYEENYPNIKIISAKEFLTKGSGNKNKEEWSEEIKKLPEKTRVKLAEYCAQQFLDGVAQRDKEIREKIEEYFKGLIAIPNPQETKKNLLQLISTKGGK